MIMTRNLVKEITGHTINIIRFPSRSSRRLNKNMLEKLHKNGFRIFDWNINLDDGISPSLAKQY